MKEESSQYTVIKPFILLNGGVAASGGKVELTAKQAKYLLLSGKIKAAETTTGSTKPASKKKEN